MTEIKINIYEIIYEQLLKGKYIIKVDKIVGRLIPRQELTLKLGAYGLGVDGFRVQGSALSFKTLVLKLRYKNIHTCGFIKKCCLQCYYYIILQFK